MHSQLLNTVFYFLFNLSKPFIAAYFTLKTMFKFATIYKTALL